MAKRVADDYVTHTHGQFRAHPSGSGTYFLVLATPAAAGAQPCSGDTSHLEQAAGRSGADEQAVLALG
jgi:hypothetical protein